jgi:hypothetical protein
MATGMDLTQLPFSELLDSLPFGGHGYDIGAAPVKESSGDDDGGGIGAATIIGLLLLTVGTVGLLVWLSPSRTRARLKAVAPLGVLVLIIAMPLIVWAASSGDSEKSLMVERVTGLTGNPELLVSLGDDELNNLETTNGRKAVRVQCLGRDGKLLLDKRQKWPFILEKGYEFPHAHQPATEAQVQGADRCRLRGTDVSLEAEVEGSLSRRL